MKRINLIDSSIYNRISAGEVIERPMSVVKECVENSIDGGANSICVKIFNNAKNIRIIDDGIGMSKEDALVAFLPHATSKISCVEDLECIETLGFRGEALASIAAVAQIVLKTFDKETKESTQIDIKGGEIIKVDTCAIDEGTDIFVENLFFNTPVREKFLKSTKAEEGMIYDLMSKFVLAYPDKKFSLYINDELKIKFDGNGFEKALYCIYGKAAVDNTFYIDEEKNGIRLKGYISKITYTKPNRTYQTVILNGRNVVNETVSMSIFRAYQPYLLKRNFPFYALHMTINSEDIDVNVHPTKHDVRFSEPKKVFSSIYSIISTALKKNGTGNIFAKQEVKSEEIGINEQIIIKPVKVISEEEQKKPFEILNDKKVIYDGIELNNLPVFSLYPPAFPEDLPFLTKEQRVEFDKSGITLPNIKRDTSNVEVLYDTPPHPYVSFDNLRVIGVFDSTYIIAECDSVLYLVDQHAAHERILFDRYCYQYYNEKIVVQDLLVPYILNLNAIEDDFMRYNIPNLYVLGFNIEPFGHQTYRVLSVPQELCDIDFEKFFAEILSEDGQIINESAPTLIRERIMQKACKNAVKAGKNLSLIEIKELFDMLNYVNTLTCPHGRPIIVKLTKRDIEKMFKRII
ncbi:MAG: DNA mismatch repair endonuclease MutL [Clostridia bacterium]|nr:DNA mismatch repair endonuclease MutL [Clostridia bacterium]